MLNKKGIIEEGIASLTTFIIAGLLLLLLFYGCEVSKAKKEYEQFEFSKGEVQVFKDLNHFLNVPVETDKLMSDKITEILGELFRGTPSLDDFENSLNPIVFEHIPEYRRLMMLTPEGSCCYYDSDGRYIRYDYEDIQEAIVVLSVPVEDGEDGYEFIPIVMQYLVPPILE